jgi:peptidyl-prolyl cis-trans isomerase C
MSALRGRRSPTGPGDGRAGFDGGRAGPRLPGGPRPGPVVRSSLAALAFGVLLGCAARPPAASGSGGPASDPPPPVARVGGTRISKADLSDFVFQRYRETWLDALDALVDERITASEASRLGVVVPPAALDAAVEAEAKARGEQVKARFGDSIDLASSVKQYYGLDVPAWKRDVLRPRLASHLALERVVRLSSRLGEQVVARVIVTKDLAKATALRQKLDRGADFSLIARQDSEDPSGRLGGVLAPLARGDLAAPAVEQALFSASPGELIGPLEVRTASGLEIHLYKVVERRPAWSGPPERIAALLEADLTANPVSRPEYDRWSVRVRAGLGVTTFAPDGSVLRGPGTSR